MNNKGSLADEKCLTAVEKFALVTTNKTTGKNSDLECLSASIVSIQNNVRDLTRKIGYATDSVSYLASEYDNFVKRCLT